VLVDVLIFAEAVKDFIEDFIEDNRVTLVTSCELLLNRASHVDVLSLNLGTIVVDRLDLLPNIRLLSLQLNRSREDLRSMEV